VRPAEAGGIDIASRGGNSAPMTSLPPERIAVVDVLRAFALLGIIITHAEMGFLAGPPPGQDFMQFSPSDEFVRRWVAILVESKFFSIFSFLFGLSFAIQLDNSAQKGTAFAGRFAWRLTVLFLIGMAHQLLFNGDILMIYAALGLLLLPLGRMRSSVLLVVALLLLLNVPGLVQGIARINAPPPTAEEQKSNAKIAELYSVGGPALYTAAKSGSLVDIARANFGYGLEMKWQYQLFTGRFWITFGCFLLGLCAGRANLFRASDTSRRFFKRLLVGAGGVALLSTMLMLTYTASGAYVTALMHFASSVQKASLAATYVAIIVLLFWSHSRSVLSQLAPLGKMGLTTYLVQSVFLAVVFYGIGFGMMGEIGSAAAAGLGAAFFIAQVFIARWWLQRFTMGPVEWLWRSVTYLRWQPLRPELRGLPLRAM
jgi:uncharacterized protein